MQKNKKIILIIILLVIVVAAAGAAIFGLKYFKKQVAQTQIQNQNQGSLDQTPTMMSLKIIVSTYY